MSDRPLSDLEKKLKHLSRGLIADAGGVEASASCHGIRVGKTQFGAYQNLNHDQFMPLDVLICLTEATGNPQLLEEVARRCGYRIERLSAVASGEAMQHVAAVAKEAAEVVQAAALGLADGHLCAQDSARLEAEMLDVQRVAGEGAAAIRAARLAAGTAA
ncbi:phage regulatory CII family protein [Pararoseomonas indoligenes]|uniref:Uncharacterized protein n=1 Tax=Roseomonas indoligenes TaxID=2820811 RepID=A0A940MVQ9_9PROT|nr:phage regulatory CII family protein [Pararoseomonas indoligenes]MBP0492107.1 hypothetical protein [Pararoseomonas indoligenes]